MADREPKIVAHCHPLNLTARFQSLVMAKLGGFGDYLWMDCADLPYAFALREWTQLFFKHRFTGPNIQISKPSDGFSNHRHCGVQLCMNILFLSASLDISCLAMWTENLVGK